MTLTVFVVLLASTVEDHHGAVFYFQVATVDKGADQHAPKFVRTGDTMGQYFHGRGCNSWQFR